VTDAEAYLSQVRAAMAGMEPAVREDILKELRSHLAESAAANGGDVSKAIVAMGSPSDVGQRYRNVYGFGRAFKGLFVAASAALGVLSSAVLQGTQESYVPNLLSLPALVVLVGFLLWVSVRAGGRAGLYAGLGACLARIASVFVLAFAFGGVLTDVGTAFLATSSALLILLGWLPGTARQAWTRKGAEL
jgi:uncharacterized membrane protein